MQPNQFLFEAAPEVKIPSILADFFLDSLLHASRIYRAQAAQLLLGDNRDYRDLQHTPETVALYVQSMILLAAYRNLRALPRPFTIRSSHFGHIIFRWALENAIETAEEITEFNTAMSMLRLFAPVDEADEAAAKGHLLVKAEDILKGMAKAQEVKVEWFACQHCAGCCRSGFLGEATLLDLSLLQAANHRAWTAVELEYSPFDGADLLGGCLANGPCPYLHPGGRINSCSLQGLRPTSCREFPSSVKDALDAQCPGLKASPPRFPGETTHLADKQVGDVCVVRSEGQGHIGRIVARDETGCCVAWSNGLRSVELF